MSGPVTAAAGIHEVLLDWWERARTERDRLPWRSTRDPWAILLAETMLGQTQVARVAERFEVVLARFASPSACAAAPLGDLLRSWSGLGYNRRALQLHAAARAIVERHGGEVPGTLEELLALPGVGPYTARAVLSCAFAADVAVVDTNVGRVLARAVTARPLKAREAQSLADSLVPSGSGREWNLAMMDFGSLVCGAARPLCVTCPLAAKRLCAWRVSGAEVDPSRGSASVSTRQAPFAGSDREGRGSLVRAACAAPIAPRDVPVAAGWPDDAARAGRVAAALLAEGILALAPDGSLVLP